MSVFVYPLSPHPLPQVRLQPEALQGCRTRPAPQGDQVFMVSLQQVPQASRPPVPKVAFLVWLAQGSQVKPDFRRRQPQVQVSSAVEKLPFTHCCGLLTRINPPFSHFWSIQNHPFTQGSPQVNLDCISKQPSILEDLGCKPQQVRDTTVFLVILEPGRTQWINTYTE